MLPEFDLKTVMRQFAELWDKEEERKFFERVEAFGYQHSSDNFRSQRLLFADMPVELSLVPARFLPVVCGLDLNGEIRPTPTGRIIRSLNQQFKKKGILAFFVLTSGAAKEAVCGAKPFCKTRTNKEGTLPLEKYDFHFGKPKMDGDFLLVSPDINEGMVREILGVLPKDDDLEIKFKKSESRPISMIKVTGVTPQNSFDGQRERRCLIAQISAPEFRASSSFNHPFMAQIFSGDTNSRFILIIPTQTEEGFVGAEMNFFPDCRKNKISFWQKNHEGKLTKRSLKIAFIPYFDEAFPVKYSPAEAFVHYCHFLRNITWDNHLRLTGWPDELKSLGDFEARVRETSYFTSIKIAQEIVYPIAQKPSLIVGNTKSILHQTNRLFEGMKNLLDGDPYLGLIYLLSAGENPTNTPVFGTGLIDKRGLLPELYGFLHRGSCLQELFSIMETCDYGIAKLGWSTFVNFIYEKTGRNLRKVDGLFCPTFCSNDIFPTLVDNYVRKALSKFYPIPLRDPCTGAFPRF